ncbi:hypothetical protein N7470_004790 [Penicillium chermesinum]|nr:hypothetical protein N7470_004790 [Penicillium chermesinum]
MSEDSDDEPSCDQNAKAFGTIAQRRRYGVYFSRSSVMSMIADSSRDSGLFLDRELSNELSLERIPSFGKVLSFQVNRE